MRPEHRLAMQNVCDTQEKLQPVWDNPEIFKFGPKHQAWVIMYVATNNGEFVWSTCVRLANPVKRNFKPTALWTAAERLKARSILFDQLSGVGQELGTEEFDTTQAMHYSRKVTTEERNIILKPHLLGS